MRGLDAALGLLAAATLVGACATTEPEPVEPVEPTPPAVQTPPATPTPPPVVEPSPVPPVVPPPPPTVTPTVTPTITPTPIADAYRAAAARILAAARGESRAWERLTHLCYRIGHRLSGSEGLERAVEWASATMESDGLDDVRKELVLVPAWVRGEESAEMIAPRRKGLDILGLGLSVGTPEEGIEADVIVLRDFDELEARAADVPGKIVLFNYPMPAYDPERGSGYGTTVRYRSSGPSRAAEKGAVAMLVRSVTATSLNTPHTGMLSYRLGKPRIPAAAVTIEDAEMIAYLTAAGETVRVRLAMDAHMEPSKESANVVGELRGTERPEEIVVFGGHLDSWDVGQGAHDDGAACVAVMEAMRLLRRLGMRPRRTIRAVLFTNEENGLAGATQYALQHKAELPAHVAALEADSGMFRPLGLSTPAAKDAAGERRRARLTDLLTLFREIGADRLTTGGGGADISPMAPAGVPQIGLRVDGRRYFDYHHTHADTLDKVSREDLELCVGVLAATVYVLADMPDRLGD